MSDTRSVGSIGDFSSSSAPIFSADDQNIDLHDPDFTSVLSSGQLGGLPYSSTTSALYEADAVIIPGGPPVSTDSSQTLLYSFTDPAASTALPTKPATNREARIGIIDSFGVSPHLYQSTLAKPKVPHSTSAPVISSGDSYREDEEVPPLRGSSDGLPGSRELLSTDGVVLGSKENTPTPVALGASLDTHLGSPQDIQVLTQDIHTPTVGSPQDTHPLALGLFQDIHLSPPPIVTESAGSSILQDQMTLKDTPPCIDSSNEPAEFPYLDSDIETASIVSVQHLTETYLNEPTADDAIDDSFTPLSEGGKIPFTFPIITSVKSPPGSSSPSESIHGPQRDMGPSSPNRTNPSTGILISKVPAHIHPPLEKPLYIYGRTNMERPISLPPPILEPSLSQNKVAPVLKTHEEPRLLGSRDTVDVADGKSLAAKPSRISEDDLSEMERLEDRLAEEQRVRSYLEGQLEAVEEECEAALKERPSLLSKLSRVETQLAEAASALERERNKPKVKPDLSPRGDRPQMEMDLRETTEALEQQKKVAIDLKNDFIAERQKSNRLERNLDDSKRILEEQGSIIAELQDKLKSSKLGMNKKEDENEERACKLASLEASYNALEKNKSWLHDQLQNALESKLKLQEKVREIKTHGITEEIKLNQLHKENGILQNQISDLQMGVLQDKAKMVSQLEAIEADVLSHEDLYAKLVSEKAQLEDIAKRKDDTVSQLNSDLARAQVSRDELKQKVEELSAENNNLAQTADKLEKERANVSSKLKACLRDLDYKESDLKEMSKVKNSLLDKLRQTDVEMMSKDGTIQSLRDANELLQHELDLVNEARENIAKELGGTKRQAGELETDLKSALDSCRGKDLRLREIDESRHSVDDQKQALHALLAEKEEEVEQKEEAIKALETQVRDLLGEFGTLRDNFKSIASESGSVTDSIAEKDRVISHLASEKDKSEEELLLLRKENQELHEELGQLQHEKAHLQGQVEGSINQEDYHQSLQDKTRLQADISVLQLDAQRNKIKSQAKINRLEADLKGAQETARKAQTELCRVKDARDEEVGNLNEAKYQSEAKLKEVEEELKKVLRERERAEELQNSSKPSQGQLEILRTKSEELMKQNLQLTDQLQEEAQHRVEIERASGLVAKKLKQNAEKDKKDLIRKNRDVTLELERLRGRLAGMHTTQITMRDHATTLEIALAKKESSIVKLFAETQNVLEKKALEDKAFEAQIVALENQLQHLNTDAASRREKAFEESRRLHELEMKLSKRDSELATLQAELSKRNPDNSKNEHLASLSLERDALQTNVSYLKSQLLVSKTSAESAKREVADKQSQIEILERELKIAESKSLQAEAEVKQLKHHLKESENDVESSRVSGEKGSERHFGSLSTISGADETDNPAIPRHNTESIPVIGDLDKMSKLNDTLRELGSRVEQARQQGHDAAELKKSGEISVLKQELGSKSRTLSTLQSYLHSLKDDMNKLHQQMDHHSTAVKESKKSSRLIESQIENLRRSSALPAPFLAAQSQ